MAFADGNIIIGTSVDVGGIDTGLAKIKKSFGKLGALTLGLAGVRYLYKLSKAAIDAASDLQEIQNVVDVAFKDMSYKIEDFSKVCIQYFGMSQLSAKQTAGSFMAMGESIGIVKEVASDMAVELTGLSGDFASFYNISQEYAKVALSAIYTGETETIKRYGIILTEANLQEYALSQGIEKKVKAMNAAEKTLLRYNYVMSVTSHLHHDFERTQESWANTLRVLKERWVALLSAIGGGTIKVVQPAIELIDRFVSKMLSFVNYMNELLGITSQIGSSEFSDQMGEIEESVNDAGNAIKNQLGSFDKLNNIVTSGSGDDDNITDLTKLYDMFQNTGYVIDYMNQIQLRGDELSEKAKKNINDIVKAFRKAKNRINKIVGQIKLGKMFSVGKSVGEVAGDLQQFFEDALGQVKWEDIGVKVGKFFEGITWSNALFGWIPVMTTAIEGVITSAIAAVKTFDLGDIVKIAEDLSNAVLTVTGMINRVLTNLPWDTIGTDIGTFLVNLKWSEILGDVITAIGTALSGLATTYTNLFDAAPIATAIATAVVGAITVDKFTQVGPAIEKAIELRLKKWRKDTLNKDGTVNLNSSAAKVFEAALGTIMIGLSIGFTVERLGDIKEAELDANSIEAKLKTLVAAIFGTLGVKLVASAIGLTFGATGILATTAVLFTIGMALNFAFDPGDEVKTEKLKEDFRNKLANVSWFKELQESIDVVVNLKVNATGKIAEITGDTNYYSDLAEKWYELSQNQDNLTEAEKALMRIYSDELVTMFPDLASKIDLVSGAYKGTWEQLDILIQKTDAYLKLQAYEGIKKDYYSTIAQNEDSIIQAEDRLAELRSMLERLLPSKGGFNTRTMSFDINPGMIAYNIATKMQQTPAYALLLHNLGLDDYQSAAKYIAQQVTAAVNASSRYVNVGGVKWDLADILYDFNPEIEGESVFDLFTEIETTEAKINEYQEAINTAERSINRLGISQSMLLQSLQDKELNDALDTMTKKVNKVFKGTSKWGSKVESAVNTVKEKLEKHQNVDKELQALYDLIDNAFKDLPKGNMPKDVQEALDKILSDLKAGKISYYDAGVAIADALNEGYVDGLTKDTKKIQKKRNDFHEEILEESSNTADGFSSSVNYTSGYDAGYDFGEGVVDGTKAAVKVASPSKVFKQIGEYVVEGFVMGLENDVDDLSLAADSLVSAVTENIDKSNILPTISIVPEIDMASITVPDVVNGGLIPASITVVPSTATIAGMSKSELSGIIKDAVKGMLSDINVNAKFDVSGDPAGMFNVWQKEARAYTSRTGALPI